MCLKKILFCFLVLIGINSFAQSEEPILVKPKTEYSYSLKSNLKLSSAHNLIPDVATDIKIINYEIGFDREGKHSVIKGKKEDFITQLNASLKKSDLNSKFLLYLQFMDADDSIHSNRYVVNITE
ncbi:MAG: hypothetical protein IPM51_16680 [Sphingobacteriaceae bacterium]|nr:hypothetical protein [Sphingobacteriaceae bacterium]